MNRLPVFHSVLTIAVASSCALFALPASAADDPVKRGEYLINTSGCHDCHTPWIMGKEHPEPDMTRALSGHPADMKMPPPPKLPDGPWIMLGAASNTAWAGPWGVSYTANLTPDKDTGLGEWTERNFFDAIRTGRHMGKGRPILPPMPIQVYKNYTDADLSAVFAYLRSIKPIKNEVPDPLPPEGAAPPAGAKPAGSK
ncbi:MAG: diheme cytochrome c-553 [Lautropia sp.]